MKKQKFSIKKRLNSFSYAFTGLRTLFQEEHNARIHLVAAVLVIIFGFIYDINEMEWIAIILAIGFVITTEAINAAIENLSDIVSPEKDKKIKKTKDIAAGAVIFSSLVALTIAAIIFLPKIFNL